MTKATLHSHCEKWAFRGRKTVGGARCKSHVVILPAAHQQWDQVADALRKKFPKLADMMDASRADVLAYMTFPKDHWAQIASTNPLERVNKEIQRRADVIGIFPNDAAVVRLVGALMLEQNDEWAVSRRYMTLATLGSVSHNPIVSLPALAA